jgi:ribosome maturation factor RimP
LVRASPAEAVGELLEPVIRQLGLQLLDVSWHPGKGRAVLRLTVDRPGGITVNECSQLSETASALLDRREELLPGSYALEVSSPGAERTLSTERDFATALGRRVRLTVEDGERQTVVEGKLVGLGPEELDLEVRRTKGGRLRTWRVNRRQVSRAQVVVDI